MINFPLGHANNVQKCTISLQCLSFSIAYHTADWMAWTACYHTAAYGKGDASSRRFAARTMIISLQCEIENTVQVGRHLSLSSPCIANHKHSDALPLANRMTYDTIGICSKSICSTVIRLPKRGTYTKKSYLPTPLSYPPFKKYLLSRLTFAELMLHQATSFVSQKRRGALGYFNEWVRATLIILLYSYTLLYQYSVNQRYRRAITTLPSL